MTSKTIEITKWHPTPKFRFRNEYQYCGEAFREDELVPALKQFEYVHVDLTGYNRYGPSFIDEAFANLIRKEGYTYEYLKAHLTYSHELLKRVELQIAEKIEKAASE